jgi:protein-L-isoaspartate(D-aspartate) O-methyltransferase
MDETRTRREEMVAYQLVGRGLRHRAVLEAMRRVPREAFVPPEMADEAYEDRPLPIQLGQTISQPYVVALMAAEVEPEPDHRILEIGTGSGYGAAVLSHVAAEVYTVERHRALADQARERLARLGMGNVTVLHGDGTRGWPEHAPYDGIVVTAGATAVPEALRRQLRVGGVLLIPVGEHPPSQTLLKIRRTGEDRFSEEDLGGVSFVPLVGE